MMIIDFDFVFEGVIGIIVVVIDVNGVLFVVKVVRVKGIKIVVIDVKFVDGSVDIFVGVDNVKVG